MGTVKSILNLSMIGNTSPWSLVLKLGLTKNTLCGNVFMSIMSLGTFGTLTDSKKPYKRYFKGCCVAKAPHTRMRLLVQDPMLSRSVKNIPKTGDGSIS